MAQTLGAILTGRKEHAEQFEIGCVYRGLYGSMNFYKIIDIDREEKTVKIMRLTRKGGRAFTKPFFVNGLGSDAVKFNGETITANCLAY